MIPLMAPPSRSSSAAPVVPEQLRPLVKQLTELSEGDLDLVYRAAKLRGLPNDLPTLPWEEFDKVKGIVSLGGNADEDCKALYDG
jgi:hypothetical protein